MRTPAEIAAEIAALKALKPIGRFARKTADGILLQLEELEFGMDQTCEEWNELGLDDQALVEDTRAWKECRSDKQPSKEWGGLVEKAEVVM